MAHRHPSRRLQSFLCFPITVGASSAYWNILNVQKTARRTNELDISLKNYPEGSRMNVELHNIREFEIAPEECISYIGKYMTSTQYRGREAEPDFLEEWMKKAKAPALEHSLKLFNEIKGKGIQIILVSSRREHIRSATVDDLVTAGFHCWSSLILRGPDDDLKGVQDYKAQVRNQLVNEKRYRIWGILGDQFSGIEGLLKAKRT